MINEQKKLSKFFELFESSKFVDVFIVNNDNNDNNDDTFYFVVKNIEFFDFNYNNKFATIELLLNNINNETIFRNVYCNTQTLKKSSAT